MPKERGQRGQTVSFYLTSAAVEKLKMIRAGGKVPSETISDFLDSVGPNFAGELRATGYNHDVNMAAMMGDDNYRVENWITPDVTSAYLMGTTLYGVLLEDKGKGIKQVWRDLLEKNVKMQVLIQDMGTEGFDINALSKLKGEPVDILKAHSQAVTKQLSVLAQQHQNLEVRTSDILITSSAILAFRKGPQKISGQIHPYSGSPNRGLHFSFNVNQDQFFDQTPFALLWRNAKPLK